MRICIVGAGNIGIASAVDLSLKHSVVLLSKKADLPNEFIGIDYDKTIKSNTIKTTNNAKEALCNADIVFVTLPSFLIDDFLRANETYFAPPQHSATQQQKIIIYATGYGSKELFSKRLIDKGVVVASLSRVPYVARLHSKDSVYGYKKPQIACSAINGDTARICKIVEEIFEIPCECVENYLSISLTPSNPILHTSRLYALFRDKTAFKSQIKFYASWDDFSSQILIDLDRELEKIAENFGINHTTIRTHYNAHSVESLTAKISSITSLKNIESPLKKCDDVYVIDKDSRYFSEDFPFGLCVLRGFAEIAQVETPTMDKVLQWYQGLFGVEYFDENGVFNGKDLDKSGIPQNFGLRTKSDIIKFYAIQNFFWGGGQ